MDKLFTVRVDPQHGETPGRINLQFNVPYIWFSFLHDRFFGTVISDDEWKKHNMYRAVDSFLSMIREEVFAAYEEALRKENSNG